MKGLHNTAVYLGHPHLYIQRKDSHPECCLVVRKNGGGLFILPRADLSLYEPQWVSSVWTRRRLVLQGAWTVTMPSWEGAPFQSCPLLLMKTPFQFWYIYKKKKKKSPNVTFPGICAFTEYVWWRIEVSLFIFNTHLFYLHVNGWTKLALLCHYTECKRQIHNRCLALGKLRSDSRDFEKTPSECNLSCIIFSFKHCSWPLSNFLFLCEKDAFTFSYFYIYFSLVF